MDPCISRRCGLNAVCRVEDRRSYCECVPGFTGDARIECGPIKLEKGPLFEPYIQADEGIKYERHEKRCTKPEMCGLSM